MSPLCPHTGGAAGRALEPDSLSLECDPDGRDILLHRAFPYDVAVSSGTGLGSAAVDYMAIVLYELSIASVSMESERGHLGGHLGAGQGQKGRWASGAGRRPEEIGRKSCALSPSELRGRVRVPVGVTLTTLYPDSSSPRPLSSHRRRRRPRAVLGQPGPCHWWQQSQTRLAWSVSLG